MKLSLRSKVLGAYGILALLVVTVPLISLVRLKQIGTRLTVIQGIYMKLSATLGTLRTYYHLDDAFDVQRIIAGKSNAPFLESVTQTGPKMLESTVERAYEDAENFIREYSDPQEAHNVRRIGDFVREMLRQHHSYAQDLQRVAHLVEIGQTDLALKMNDQLLSRKRVTRSRIEFVSRRVSDRIRNGIQATVREERLATYWTIGLSTGALILTAFMGIVTALIFRPLRELKTATQKIAAGDFSRRVEVTTQDEIGELGEEFNRMAKSIQHRDEVLKVQQEQLVQSERMAVVGRMASKISHEIRNPLNALSLNVEMLSDELTTSGAKQTLEAISKEIDRLNRVVESYLSMARKPKPEKEETDVVDLLKHLETLLEVEIRSRGLRFELSTPDNLPKLRIDPHRMEQALMNLARNAMEALPSGGRFGIRATRTDEQVIVEVWDQGTGIPTEQAARIFDPFFTTKEKGTGLGLSITSEIIREQGGTIAYSSRPDEKTVFTIHLPEAA